MLKKLVLQLLLKIVIMFSNLIAQDFKINETGNASFNPAIAMSSNRVVVVWTDSPNGNKNNETGSSIYGQIFTNDGIRINNNFLVNEDTTRDGNRIPDVSMNDEGNIVVAWHVSSKIWGDTDIYARVFDKNGVPLTSSFKVNDDSTNTAQLDAQVIILDNGSFLISWTDRREDFLFSYAQLYDNQKNTIGRNFLINKNKVEDNAKLSHFSDDKYLLNWDKYIQILNAEGNPVSNIIDIGIRGSSFGIRDSILVIWDEQHSTEFWASFFDQHGTQISQPFKINNDDFNTRTFGDIAFFKGGFILVWTDHRNDFNGIIGTGDIYAQRYDSFGNPLGTNFKVNHEAKEYTQRNPVTTINGNYFFTVWLEIHPKCFPEGTVGNSPSFIMGTIQEFSDPIPGKILGWETFVDSCNEDTPLDIKNLHIYPNPFYSSTNITFTLFKESFVDISIYNILGQRIKTISAKNMTTGNHLVEFESSSFSNGIYFIWLKSNSLSFVSKIVISH